MQISKSIGGQVGIASGVALVLGLCWQARSMIHSRGDAPSAGKIEPIQTKRDRAERPEKNAPTPLGKMGTVLLHPSFTVDELTAIYESRGAAAALAAAKSMTGPERASQVVFILTYLARIDPEFVAGELKDAELDTTHQGFIVDAVMNSWKDGKKALEWATSNFTGDLLKRAAGGALHLLTRSDPQAALAYLETLSAGGSRRQAIADIFVPWGEYDPKAAMKLISENFPADDQSSALSYVISGWSRLHLAEAAAWVGAVQDETLKARLVSEIVRNWRFKSLPEATAWVESLPEGPSKNAGRAVLQEKVMTIECGFSTEVTPGPDVSWKTKTVTTMGSSDFWNWAIQDPEGARKFLETAPEGKGLTHLAAATAFGISTKEGHESAFAWAQTLPGEAGKEALRCTVISWAGSDPAATAKKLEAIAPEQRAPLATALAENWAQHDPATAAAWVATYDGAEQKSLVREVLQRWTDSQPREAYAWLGTLPMGPSRDAGISYLLRREAPSDPKSVVPWIELVSTPKLREEMRRDLDGYLKAERKGK